MKTDLSELSKAYRDSLRKRTAERGASCPEPGRLADCALGKARRRERAEILAHAADCAACAEALKKLLALSEVADEAAAKLASRPAPAKKPFRLRPAFKPAAVAAAALLVITALAVWLPRFANRPTVRGGGTHIVLLSPLKKAPAGNVLVFKWRGVTGADGYAVEIFDKSFRSLWKSGRLTGDEVRLPDDVRGRLAAGETYYWTVRTTSAGGTEIKSSLAEFSLAR